MIAASNRTCRNPSAIEAYSASPPAIASAMFAANARSGRALRRNESANTTPAKNTLVVVTEVDGHRIAVASLGAPSGYSTDGARLLTRWANRNFDGLLGVGRLPLS